MLGTERVGARVYVTGDSYPICDRLKRVGCHWDSDRRQWWIGATKAEELTAILDSDEPTPQEDFSQSRVYGKVGYKERTYFVIAVTTGTDKPRVRLTTLDGSHVFWTDESEVRWVKRYTPRKDRYGTTYQTLDGLRRFVQQQKEAEAAGDPPCAACGRRGRLVEDLEDGLLKCRGCCDIPSE
jgi:hypothetical protein